MKNNFIHDKFFVVSKNIMYLFYLPDSGLYHEKETNKLCRLKNEKSSSGT